MSILTKGRLARFKVMRDHSRSSGYDTIAVRETTRDGTVYGGQPIAYLAACDGQHAVLADRIVELLNRYGTVARQSRVVDLHIKACPDNTPARAYAQVVPLSQKGRAALFPKGEESESLVMLSSEATAFAERCQAEGMRIRYN
jgi:hypothetical protein